MNLFVGRYIIIIVLNLLKIITICVEKTSDLLYSGHRFQDEGEQDKIYLFAHFCSTNSCATVNLLSLKQLQRICSITISVAKILSLRLLKKHSAGMILQ